jgi:hypothetical protein
VSAPRSNTGTLTALLLMSVSALVIGEVRPRLVSEMKAVALADDSYPLPPPDQMPLVSLGYRAAGADILWAYVLVAQGLRLAEHREFSHGPRYFESIFALDPTYREPYLSLDTILTFNA